MDRTIFGRKTLNTQRNRVDRFVAPRDSFGEGRRRRSFHVSSDNSFNNDFWFGKQLKHKKYATYLDDAFNLEPQETIGIPKHWIRPWPCIPRKKSYLSSADSILDLPTYSYATFPELLDWSNDNILVAALGRNYHKWSWRSQSLISQGHTLCEIQCCKFDPRGELLVVYMITTGTDGLTCSLRHGWESHKDCTNIQDSIKHLYGQFKCLSCAAIPQPPVRQPQTSAATAAPTRRLLTELGTDMNTVEVHSNNKSKKISSNLCPCSNIYRQYCSVTAVDWSPTGNSFVTGCSWGNVVSYTREAKLLSWNRLKLPAILLVRVSPDARYVAVTGLNADVVILLTWPSLEIYSTLESSWTIRTMAWHPWRSALLGVGAVTPDHQGWIALWNAPTTKFQVTTVGPKRYSLDAMLFSDRTGELVLSLWNSDRAILHPKACSQLVVMSDPETIVDQCGEGRSGLDRVRTMVFSPDGTKLATATSDEDLIIWNFLPEDKRKKPVHCKRFSALPVYLDEAMQGYSLR